ncbi:hypothetical protein KC999_16545 [Proteus mirabilis]|nr:hypothetical protein [Proteus mirabilis]
MEHKVRLLQTIFVKAFVIDNKNDVMDARTIWMTIQRHTKSVADKISRVIDRQWLSVSFHETRRLGKQIGLSPRHTAVRSPQSNGIAESFVIIMKRDYAKT